MSAVLTGSAPHDQRYLTTKQVRQRYGNISRMTLYRWQRGWTDAKGRFHPPLPGFPAPVYLSEHPFWRLSELEAWEQSRERAKLAA